ncbi:isoprenylcysteine carboxylmethyltransferase family protein, partial [Shewanella sp.]|uniref:methyltransferase family protein n=1 Tax=Shewanella sp. TaxID=50422 RepID=UPI0025856F78
KRVKTNIEPWKPTTKIISTGIYAYSRNPIYLAFCTIPLGLGLFFSHIWLMLSVIPACISVYYLAIRPEEAYLTEKFGDEYLAYRSRVRRWL